MNQSMALGLWQSNFGAVKLEQDSSGGAKAIMGAWLYDRGGQEVIGYFTGDMRGNVLEFVWHESAQPSDLLGRGFISFDPNGTRFDGKWWSYDRRRSGGFRGWRDQVMNATDPASPPDTNGPF